MDRKLENIKGSRPNFTCFVSSEHGSLLLSSIRSELLDALMSTLNGLAYMNSRPLSDRNYLTMTEPVQKSHRAIKCLCQPA